MKLKWLAIAISAAVPAIAFAQQDAKENNNPDQEIQPQRAKADAERAQADVAVENAKRAIEVQAYDRALGKVREQRLIKAAWLGLSASQAPAALRKQLKLPDGTGLVIDFIQPDSPAAKAGLKQYDLLTKLGGQLLINSEQLSVLVRTFKSGSKVHVEFLREGEHQSVDAELADHDVPPLADEIGVDGFSPFQLLPQTLEGTRSRDNSGRANGKPRDGISKNSVEERQTLTLLDGNRQFCIDVSDGHRVLNVVDTGSGRVISKYPVDDDAQIHALPEDIREPLGRLLPLLNGDAMAKPSPDGKKVHVDGAPVTLNSGGAHVGF